MTENEVVNCDELRNQLPIQANNQSGQYHRILEIAISQGAPLDQLEKWMDLKEKNEANEAKKAFYMAFAAFKREHIHIKKDKFNSHFKSWYSSLGNLLETVNPYLGKHGLSAAFNPSQGEKMLTVQCVLRHELGHTESVEMSAPPDTSGGSSKNPIQQIKSTFTYLRSATFEAITGLSGTEASVDDDGNTADSVNYVDIEQIANINALAEEVNADMERFLAYIKVDSVENIPEAWYDRVIKDLERKRKQ